MWARFRRVNARALQQPSSGIQGAAASHETDVVVIGAGVGGLSCAGLLAKYGLDVTVLESHTVCGGAAHVRCFSLVAMRVLHGVNYLLAAPSTIKIAAISTNFHGMYADLVTEWLSL
jgi:ribulose 1,5-bisphosphate synthetase/thiazole synthase